MKTKAVKAQKTVKLPKRTPVEVGIAQLIIAPWNPRGEITDDSVKDLVPSIRSIGLIERIAIVKAAKEKDKYVICAGNRRYVACRLAGLDKVPAEIFECSEGEARRITLIENLKRKDAEPIYVAELIKTLREKDGLTYEEIAAEIGHEVCYVERRAKLIDLAPEWKEVAQSKSMNVTTDLLEKASRYTQEIQRDAYEYISRNYPTDKRLSWSDVAIQFESRTCDLTKATFTRKKCAMCPCNTACTPTLWDVGQDAKYGRCLDKKCFDMKQCEAERHEVEKLEKDGTKVVQVKDYYSIPQDNQSYADNTHKVACVYRDYMGRQQIRFVAKDPTALTTERKSVNEQDKERTRLIKEAQKAVKEWEKEELRESLSNRTWQLENGEFAAFILSVCIQYGYTGSCDLRSYDPGLKKLSRAVIDGSADEIDRDRYLTAVTNEIIEDEASPLKTLSLFEEANCDIDAEMKKILCGK